MEFSSTGQQLLVLYNQKKLKQFQGTFTNDMTEKYTKGCQYVLYSINEKKQKQYTRQDFIQLDFSPFVKISYISYQKMKIHQINQTNTYHQQNQHPIPSKMCQYKKYNLFGTTSGELFFIHSDYFCPTHKKNYPNDILCKYFKISSTPITKIVIKGDTILLSSSKNNGIIYLNIKNYQLIQTQQINKDQFNQKISEEFLDKYNKNIFPKRRYIYQSRVNFSDNGRILPKSEEEQLQFRQNKNNSTISIIKKNLSNFNQNNLDQNKVKLNKKKIDLQLSCVIGRNALYKRNNIFVDLKQNIISHTGCNLMILKKNKQQHQPQKDQQQYSQQKPKYSQQFLKLDNSPFSTFAQISTIIMSQDRRLLYAGTNQQNAKILVWDISTKTNFKQISLKGIMSIRKLNISQKKQHISVIGMDTKGELMLMFISLIEQEILAVYAFKTQEEYVNDLLFIPSKQFTFILCGNNYMAEWNYNGLLAFEQYNMQNPSDFIQMNQKNTNHKEIKRNKVTFYSVAFLKDILITAGSDGYLYLWSDKKIVKKQHAHPKAAILCLFASKNSKILVSGGSDGKAIVWKLSSSSIIQNIYQFSIYYQQSQIKKQIPIRYHIQSVCINKNTVIVGSRAGQIYQFVCGQQQQMDKLKQQWKKGKNLILPSYDDDIINSCSFNTSSEKMFIITQMGIFAVFNLKTMEKIKEEKIDIGKSQIIKMITCKFSPKIFIILKNSILVYYYIYNKEEKVQKFRKGKQIFKPQQNSFIKNAIISTNEKYLALLMASAQMDLYSIQLYDLTTSQNSFFKQFKILDHIPTNVQIIDFSTDNDYLICKNTQDQQTIIHLLTHQIVNPNSIQFQLQWSDQAKKTSKNIRDILALYGQQNQLLKIVQVMNHSIIATDEMGSVRVFEYPVMGVKDQLMYYRFYVEHLNEVCLCVLSQDSRLLATVGKEDKSLLLWKIRQAEDNQQK